MYFLSSMQRWYPPFWPLPYGWQSVWITHFLSGYSKYGTKNNKYFRIRGFNVVRSPQNIDCHPGDIYRFGLFTRMTIHPNTNTRIEYVSYEVFTPTPPPSLPSSEDEIALPPSSQARWEGVYLPFSLGTYAFAHEWRRPRTHGGAR